MDLILQAGLLVLSYLAGGIPTGYLVVRRLRGVDIRVFGSGNPGTANVYRVAGAKAGAITLVVDAGKGFLPVLLARHAFPGRPDFIILCGVAAIIGHVWTVFLGFKGGKGVATSAGVFAALIPVPLALTLLVFLCAMGWSGHISMGSISGAVALPLFSFLWGAPRFYSLMALAAGVLILYKHIPNMRLLLADGGNVLRHGRPLSGKP